MHVAARVAVYRALACDRVIVRSDPWSDTQVTQPNKSKYYAFNKTMVIHLSWNRKGSITTEIDSVFGTACYA